MGNSFYSPRRPGGIKVSDIKTTTDGTLLLREALSCWEALGAFRKDRTRNKNYTFGRQWGDYITVGGRRMTEYEYIVSEGNIPLKNNLIRRIVRNVLGVFRRQLGEKMDAWDEARRELAARNSLYELFSRTMEEFLISGMAVCRRHSGSCPATEGLRIDYVNPDCFFFDQTAHDVRGWDTDLVGQLHDVAFGEFCDAFVTDNADYECARRMFRHKPRMRMVELWRRERRPRRMVHDAASSRVVMMEESVWKRHPELHRLPSRWMLADVWRYYFIDMEGRIWQEGDAPGGRHPYAYKCYPFLDGEIHSFVADMIDQQRYANRLITLYDWVMRASAKGVLLLPEGAVDPDCLEEVADQWSRFNGVIVYKPRAGSPDPRQVTGNTSNLGICELLDIQLKMLEDVSGVTGALQGNLSNNSVSGTLYNQQTQNALTSLSDLLDSFSSFIESVLVSPLVS